MSWGKIVIFFMKLVREGKKYSIQYPINSNIRIPNGLTLLFTNFIQTKTIIRKKKHNFLIEVEKNMTPPNNQMKRSLNLEKKLQT